MVMKRDVLNAVGSSRPGLPVERNFIHTGGYFSIKLNEISAFMRHMILIKNNNRTRETSGHFFLFEN